MSSRYRKPHIDSDDSDPLASPARDPSWIQNRSRGAVAYKPRVEEEKSHGPYRHANEEYISGPTPFRGAGAGADFDDDDDDDDSGNNTGDEVFLDRGYHRNPESATAGPYVPIDLHNDLVEAKLRRNDIAWRNEVRAHIRRTRRAREKARKYKSRSTAAILGLVFFVLIYYLALKQSPTTLGSFLFSRYIPPHDSWMLQTREDILQIPVGHVELSDVERAYKKKIKPWEEGGWLCGSLIEKQWANDPIRNNGTVTEAVCKLARKTYNDIWETFLEEERLMGRRHVTTTSTVDVPLTS